MAVQEMYIAAVVAAVPIPLNFLMPPKREDQFLQEDDSESLLVVLS